MRINGLWTLPDNGYTLVNFEQTTKNILKYLTTLLADLLNRLEYRFGIFEKKLSFPVRSPCFPPNCLLLCNKWLFCISGCGVSIGIGILKSKVYKFKVFHK